MDRIWYISDKIRHLKKSSGLDAYYCCELINTFYCARYRLHVLAKSPKQFQGFQVLWLHNMQQFGLFFQNKYKACLLHWQADSIGFHRKGTSWRGLMPLIPGGVGSSEHKEPHRRCPRDESGRKLQWGWVSIEGRSVITASQYNKKGADKSQDWLDSEVQ